MVRRVADVLGALLGLTLLALLLPVLAPGIYLESGFADNFPPAAHRAGRAPVHHL